MSRPHYHIGLRTVKTGAAVVLALMLDSLRGADSLPIFAAIGAIVVMSRTLADSITAATTQLAGTVCGAVAGCLFVLLLPNDRMLAVGLGLILLIPICHPLRIGFAVPLTCIVFVSICLYNPANGSPVLYAVNRFLDTSIGLAVGFAVNAVLKPYNNHGLILRLFTQYTAAFVPCLDELLSRGHYPDLAPLDRQYRRLRDEVQLYADQPLPHPAQRRQETAYLRGCLQLAEKMYTELAALCGMDCLGIPDRRSRGRLAALGLALPTQPALRPDDPDSVVLNYHLNNLLDAHQFLSEMLVGDQS